MTSPQVIFTICRRTTASPYHILKSPIKERCRVRFKVFKFKLRNLAWIGLLQGFFKFKFSDEHSRRLPMGVIALWHKVILIKQLHYRYKGISLRWAVCSICDTDYLGVGFDLFSMN